MVLSQNLISYWQESFEKIDYRRSKLLVDIFIDCYNICKSQHFQLVVFVQYKEDSKFRNSYMIPNKPK